MRDRSADSFQDSFTSENVFGHDLSLGEPSPRNDRSNVRQLQTAISRMRRHSRSPICSHPLLNSTTESPSRCCYDYMLPTSDSVYTMPFGNYCGTERPLHITDGCVSSSNPADVECSKRYVHRHCHPFLSSRHLCYLLLAALVLVVVLLIGFLFLLVRHVEHSRAAVCYSPNCVRTAGTILSSVDFAIPPCQDFYQFACGRWIQSNSIPDDKASVSNFERLATDVNMALRDMLLADDDRDYEAIIKTKTFFRQCVNDTEIGADWHSVFDEWTEKLSGWPALGMVGQPHMPWYPKDDYSIEMIYAQMILGFSEDSLFRFIVAPDDRDSSINRLIIDHPALSLKFRHLYLSTDAMDVREAYKTLIRESLVLLGVEKSESISVASDIMSMETQIALVTVPDEQRQNITFLYNKIKIKHLIGNFTFFDWMKFISHIYPDRNITGEEDIIVQCWDFLNGLKHMWPKYNQRQKANFLMWRWFLKNFLDELPPPFSIQHNDYKVVMSGAPLPQLKWHSCVATVNELLRMSAGALYVRERFNSDAKAEALEMISNILMSFKEILHNEDWLTEATRAKALQKANAIIAKIGYPDFLEDSDRVNAFYENYTVYPGSYYRTKFHFLRVHTTEIFARWNTKVDKHQWITGPATVNAFYSPNHNTIIFPAGILQPVFYSEEYPASLNYGGIGVVIGHEITHGFDDKGRLYDQDGSIVEWWDTETNDQFEERASCMEKQYSSFVLKQVNLTINGKNTNGENIADNGGLKQAYQAFKKYQRVHGVDPLLPGLNLTHDQLFFLNYAQIWCSKMIDKEAIKKVQSSIHSPGSIRVLGPLSNSKHFAEAYDCPIGSPMNPEKKCHVW